MKTNFSSGLFQCASCGFMEDDFSYFHLMRCEDELICVGCYDNYLGECDIMVVEDGDDYQ